MKVQGKMFIWLAVFILVVAVVYGVWSKEAAGTTALFMAFGLSIMIGFYLAFTARRIDSRRDGQQGGRRRGRRR